MGAATTLDAAGQQDRRENRLSQSALAVLAAMPNKAETGLVFPSVRGDKRIALSVPWLAIRQHAAFHVRLHDLRHSFASIATADGIRWL